MPEIIIGVSMLLLFVGLENLIGWPAGRGVLTITLAHITYTAAFVAIVVQGRLAGLDLSIEEAALDLGAKPPAVFLLITVPLIAPAMVAGWLLGFSISLDDVVITQFTSGPGSTTLPLLIFSLVRHGVKPDINVVATMFVLVAILVTIGIAGVQRWRNERKSGGMSAGRTAMSNDRNDKSTKQGTGQGEHDEMRRSWPRWSWRPRRLIGRRACRPGAGDGPGEGPERLQLGRLFRPGHDRQFREEVRHQGPLRHFRQRQRDGGQADGRRHRL